MKLSLTNSVLYVCLASGVVLPGLLRPLPSPYRGHPSLLPSHTGSLLCSINYPCHCRIPCLCHQWISLMNTLFLHYSDEQPSRGEIGAMRIAMFFCQIDSTSIISQNQQGSSFVFFLFLFWILLHQMNLTNSSNCTCIA